MKSFFQWKKELWGEIKEGRAFSADANVIFTYVCVLHKKTGTLDFWISVDELVVFDHFGYLQ